MSEFFGQFETDKYIKKYFPDNYTGSCIEVGAAHGVASSNTLYFEKKGWRCLCIEPNPNLYKQLVKNRKFCVNYAVSDINKDDVYFHIFVLPNKDETAISSLSFDSRLLESHQIINDYRIKVKVRTLDYILEETKFFDGKLDFISIDTEGTELDVIKGLNLEKYRPKLLVVENNFNDRDIENYLKDFKYVLDFRHVINDFYLRIE